MKKTVLLLLALSMGVFVQDTNYTDNFGAGTFILEGNRYEETVLYHSAPQYMGQVTVTPVIAP